jgi:hypothetical protein
MAMTQALAILSVTILAAGCGTSGGPEGQGVSSPPPAPASAAPTEESSATPRLALSYEGGVLIVDAETLDEVADIPVDGFVRLNSAANGRHVLVSQADGFAVLDMGTWTDGHGDHHHYYTVDPALTDIRFGGAEPGHVVAHDDRLTLFSDGTGAVDVVDPNDLLVGESDVWHAAVRTPHHGVAVARADRSIVVSVGDEETRSGLEILDSAGKRTASNSRCPGLHGEAAAADGVLTFGCEDGILMVRDNEIRKVDSPDPYGRIGNQSGSDTSHIVLGDYKTDPDADLERPQQFSLTDTTTGTIRIVPMDASYSFRSLDRGPAGEAVILGTDGALHVFDAVTAERVGHFKVIDAWTEPDEWQSPMPNLHVQDGIAYITDPNARRLLAVNLGDGGPAGAVVAESTLDRPTIELTGVTG